MPKPGLAGKLDELLSATMDALREEGVPQAVARRVQNRLLYGHPGDAGTLIRQGQRFPIRAVCMACVRPVLVVESRETPGFGLMLDPEPDGEGDHYDTVLTEDLSRVSGSGEAIVVGCKGRFPLYRPHPWSCPKRLACPGGEFGLWEAGRP